jgi:hypothetical protein
MVPPSVVTVDLASRQVQMADAGGIKATIARCYEIEPTAFTPVPTPCYTLSYGLATSRQSLRSLTLPILNMELARQSTLPVSNPRGDSLSI